MSDAAQAPNGPPEQAVSDDAFLGGRLRVLQPATGYRAGIDGVLLAATAEAGAGAPRRDAVFHLNGGELRKAVAGGGLAPLHSGGTPTDPIQLVPGQAGSYILYTDPARGLYLEPV